MLYLRILKRILLSIGLMITMFYFLVPILWMFLSSIQPEGELTSVPPKYIPTNVTFDNFRSFFDPKLRSELHLPGVASEVNTSLLNSTIIAFLVTLTNLAFGVPAAYSFARFSTRSVSVWYIVLLICRMVPAVAIVVPFYIGARALGLVGTYPSVILAHSVFTLPLVVWILRGFFIQSPPDIEESALLDGCTRIGALFRVVLPVIAPGLVAASVFAFMFSWNEFFFSLVLTAPTKIKTVPVVAALFASDIMLKYGVMNAAAVVAIFPPVVLTLVFSRYIRQGLTAGAVR